MAPGVKLPQLPHPMQPFEPPLQGTCCTMILCSFCHKKDQWSKDIKGPVGWFLWPWRSWVHTSCAGGIGGGRSGGTFCASSASPSLHSRQVTPWRWTLYCATSHGLMLGSVKLWKALNVAYKCLKSGQGFIVNDPDWYQKHQPAAAQPGTLGLYTVVRYRRRLEQRNALKKESCLVLQRQSDRTGPDWIQLRHLEHDMRWCYVMPYL